MTLAPTPDDVRWAFRILLEREPAPPEAAAALRSFASLRALRSALLATDEFAVSNPDEAASDSPTLVIKPLASGVRVVVDLADRVVGLPILRDAFERNELAFVERTVVAGDNVIDAGAHCGLFTMTMAARVGESGSVTAVEPVAAHCHCLALGVAENRFESRVQVRHAAAGAAPGTAMLDGAGTLSAARTSVRHQAPSAPGDPNAVAIVTLDACATRRPIAFIKLDIEGSEAAALVGAARLLAEDRPIVLAEIDPARLAEVSGTSADSLIGLMAGHEYECRALGAGIEGEAITSWRSSYTGSVVFRPRR